MEFGTGAMLFGFGFGGIIGFIICNMRKAWKQVTDPFSQERLEEFQALTKDARLITDEAAKVMVTQIMANSALQIAADHGTVAGGHHKMWVIDQMVRALTGKNYDEWVKNHNSTADVPGPYAWFTGQNPEDK